MLNLGTPNSLHPSAAALPARGLWPWMVLARKAECSFFGKNRKAECPVSLQGVCSNFFMEIFIIATWQIWKQRNGLIFEHLPASLNQ